MAQTLDQRLSIVTLGVADLERSKAFYAEVFGWAPLESPPTIVFFNMGGMILALYPLDKFPDEFDARPGPQGDEPYHATTLAQNIASTEEVDRIFADLKEKGVRILKEPHKVFWGGYSGYVADPDGYAWEIAHNPIWGNDENGNPKIPS